jgi:hypothetical protein
LQFAEIHPDHPWQKLKFIPTRFVGRAKKNPAGDRRGCVCRAELVVGCLTSDLAHSSTGQAESQMMVVMRVANRSTHDSQEASARSDGVSNQQGAAGPLSKEQ